MKAGAVELKMAYLSCAVTRLLLFPIVTWTCGKLFRRSVYHSYNKRKEKKIYRMAAAALCAMREEGGYFLGGSLLNQTLEVARSSTQLVLELVGW